ncbi:MAG: MMPL family transporter [Deltaproteobacteria bacterium]|nr:MMPL family transporter [Deltaproteobacteria bacterium]
MVRIVRWVLDHALATILIVLIPTIYLGWQFQELKVNTDIAATFHPDDPDLQYYNDFYKEFGTDEFISVHYFYEDVFDLRVLRLVDRMTHQFEELPQVEQVLSVTNFNSAYNQGEILVVGSLEDELSTLESSDMGAVRERVLSDPLYYKTFLIAKDGKATNVLILLKKSSSPTYKRELVQELRSIIENAEKIEGLTVFLGGIPVYQVSLEEAYERDNRIITPILLLMIFLVLFYIFRNSWVPGTPLMIAGISVIWTLGFVAAIGKFLSPLTEVVLPLLLVYGVLNSTHLLSAYRQRFRPTEDRHHIVLEAVSQVATPCLWASVTTSLGFLSLLTSSVTTVQEFGLYSAFGVVVSYLLTFTLLPLALSRLKWDPLSHMKKEGSVIKELTVILGSFADRYRRPVLLGALLLVLLFGTWVSRVIVDTYHLQFLKENSEVMQHERLVTEKIGDWPAVEFSVGYKDGSEVLEYPVLHQMEELQQYLESFPSIDKSFSLADILKKTNQELHGGDPSFYTIPTEKNSIERLLIFVADMGGERGIKSYLSADGKRMRVTARSKILPSKEFVAMSEQIKEHLAQNFDPKLNIQLTGDLWLGQKMTVEVLDTEIQSFALAFVLIFIVLMIALRSWRLALIAIPANVFPVVIILGVMGKWGIFLDMGTCTIASIVISMAVDDTIHFLHGFRHELTQKGDYGVALRATMEKVGQPIVYTSFVLAAGFWVLVFSSFVPMVNFGLLSGIAVMAALVGDVIVLPALLMLIKPIRMASLARVETIVSEKTDLTMKES